MIEAEEKNKEGTTDDTIRSILMLDENFKIMFNQKVPLTVLVSRILGIEYEEVEGKVKIEPLTITKKERGKKKEERDLVASVSIESPAKLIIEVTYDAASVNAKGDYFLENRQDWISKVKRNFHYLIETITNSIEKKEPYDKIVRTILVDFTPYYLDGKYKEVIERCFMTTPHGKKLTDLIEYININVVKCAKLCYNGAYRSRKYNKFEKDLIVIGALIQAQGEEEAKELIKRINISKEIKESIKGVLESMSKDDLKWGRSYIKEEEEERIKQTAINLAKKDGIAEGKVLGLELGVEQTKHEIIKSLYEEGCEITYISRIVKLDTSKVEQIIKETTKQKTKRK